MLAQAWKVCSLPYTEPTYGLRTNGARFPSVRYAQYYGSPVQYGPQQRPPDESQRTVRRARLDVGRSFAFLFRITLHVLAFGSVESLDVQGRGAAATLLAVRKKAAEVVAVAKPRPSGIPKDPH